MTLLYTKYPKLTYVTLTGNHLISAWKVLLGNLGNANDHIGISTDRRLLTDCMVRAKASTTIPIGERHQTYDQMMCKSIDSYFMIV